ASKIMADCTSAIGGKKSEEAA
ncbi:MAG: hypothetical protein K0R98_1990, partial [Rickettsiaceae bacterium]|nr:hypothetical protein [Rickettsiaceae bacterium]